VTAGWPRANDHAPIEGRRLRFRPATEADLPDIMRWRTEPGVLEFYRDPPTDLDALRAQYLAADPDQPVWRFVIEEAGRGVGCIQYHHPYGGDEFAWTAGIDIFIGEPSARDHGTGTEAIRTMLAHLFETRGVRVVTIDPEVGNARAIRCYEKAGFRLDGVLRRHAYEGGEFLDTHFMSILAEEWPAAKARWQAEAAR
jgi:aminoglycoside 6'-N-acetyltransferase